MSGNEYWLFRIQDMIDAITDIQSFLKEDNVDTFLSNQHKQRTAERYFEIIGEAARFVPVDIQEEYTSIEWKNIIGMRHKIAHDYMSVSPRLLWDTYTDKLENLKLELQKLLKKEDQ